MGSPNRQFFLPLSRSRSLSPLHPSLNLPKMEFAPIANGKKQKPQKITSQKPLIIIFTSLLLFLILVPLNYYPYNTFPKKISYTYSEKNYCDIFSGEWVRDLSKPYYTNATCDKIQDHQNCMLHGRPDDEFLKWRWKPSGSDCELPVFDPTRFLELMRGKSMAFVGDSIARNHMQSLLCMLSEVEDPEDVSNELDGSQFKRYEYKKHNFTIEIFWSPFLVKYDQKIDYPLETSRLFNLYLDEADEKWTAKIERFDFVIISAGQWFFRPTMFFINNHQISCLWCKQENVTHMGIDFGFQMAYKTAFRAINNLEKYKAVTFIRTFATSHFEEGEWNEGGDCVRKRPYRKNETLLEGKNLEFYKVQIEEFEDAKRLGSKKGTKFRLFDVTRAMLMRPDGHPSKYFGKTDPSWANDCVHWCLPGPIDTWNDFLLELLKREEDKL